MLVDLKLFEDRWSMLELFFSLEGQHIVARAMLVVRMLLLVRMLMLYGVMLTGEML